VVDKSPLRYIVDAMDGIPTVSIVGRPNVGKSSLFNLLLRRRASIVHEESGVTRDRVSAMARVGGRRVQLVDTGGLGLYAGAKSGTSLWDGLIKEQVDAALECSDLVLCVVDAASGPTPLDKDVVDYLRRNGRATLLIANKSDSESRANVALSDFAELGIEDILPISCVHRRGVRELVASIGRELESVSPSADLPPEEPLAVAVVGRPNVGKSSLVNRLVGEDRVLVSDIAGTTRDAIDVPFEIKPSRRKGAEAIPAVLIDTAGLRKRGRADTAVEVFSVKRAESAVKRCDVAILVLEVSSAGVTAQDKRIARIIDIAGKGCLIVANKWDLAEGKLEKRAAIDEIRRTMPFLSHAPIVLASALTGDGFDRIGGELAALKRRIETKVPTPIVNKIIRDAADAVSASVVRGKTFKVYYATMTSTTPPEFLLFVNDPKICPKNYLSYLRNALRGKLDLGGLPIVLNLEKRVKKGQ